MKFKNRTIATIDLGTNSILLLVIQRNELGEAHVLHEGSEVVRLGEKLRETNTISDAAVDRTISAIEKYKKDIEPFSVDKVYLTATSAMREAENQSAVLERIQSNTSLEVEILPKIEEARLMFKSVMADEPHDAPSLVVDIGGGSTELGWGIGPRYDGGRSLNLGTVKLLEGPLSPENPSTEELEKARDEVARQLRRIPPLGSFTHYYGTAGSFTQGASVQLGLDTYSPQKVDHFELKKSDVGLWIDRLSKMSLEEKQSLPGVDPKRIDVLLPGFIIIEQLFKKFGNEAFIVRDRGVRFGKAFDQFRDFKSKVHFQST